MPGYGDEPDLDDDLIDAEEQLALADGEERLPWLESDDDYEPAGVDTGRIVAFAAVGLLALVLVLGGLWYFLRDDTDQAMIAEGGVIEAPDEPYRTRPTDPGGAEVEGTGDTSFEVAEGEAVESRVAGSGVVAAPAIDREQGEGEDDAPPSSSVGVQVGAYSTRAQAEAGWNQLAGRFAALQGRNHRIVQGTADSGTIFRLQALAGTVVEAETLCRTIRSQGGDCQVKR